METVIIVDPHNRIHVKTENGIVSVTWMQFLPNAEDWHVLSQHKYVERDNGRFIQYS